LKNNFLDYKRLKWIEDRLFPQKMNIEFKNNTDYNFRFDSKFMRDLFLMSLSLTNQLRFNEKIFDIRKVREFEARNGFYLDHVIIKCIGEDLFVSMFDKNTVPVDKSYFEDSADYIYFSNIEDSKNIQITEKKNHLDICIRQPKHILLGIDEECFTFRVPKQFFYHIKN
jgi:hypothetical protein